MGLINEEIKELRELLKEHRAGEISKSGDKIANAIEGSGLISKKFNNIIKK